MLVTAGKESLFTLEDMSRVRVQVNVPQAYAAQTMPGTSATVHVPEAMAKPTVGTVTRIAEGVDATTRTMVAEIELENAGRRFQPGSYAQAALTTSPDAASWTIPTNTVQMRVEGPHVAVVDDRGAIELRHVTLGRDLGRRIVVVDGIHGGERLVVNPGDDLASGTLVQLAARSNPRELAQQSTPQSAE
jgi:RND family efflux transporter MFP subunit